MDTQKDDTQAPVTVRWRQYLLDDLTLLHHAEDMVRRTKNDKSRDVIIVAIIDLRHSVRVKLDKLGGLAAAW